MAHNIGIITQNVVLNTNTSRSEDLGTETEEFVRFYLLFVLNTAVRENC